MIKAIAGIILALVCMEGQGIQDLLLPEVHHVSIVVVDQSGKPVSAARIEHSDERRKLLLTNADGRFDFYTNAPVMVIRKDGFRSEPVRPVNAADVRVVLKPDQIRPFPRCPKTGQYDGIEAMFSSFRFPRIAGVIASGQGLDADYVSRSYYVETPQGPKGIRHGSGPMWSLGLPLDRDVWRSVDYEEATYRFDDLSITDARGRMANGNRWRFLGMLGETASYSDVDDVTAKVLDKLLDGACATETAQR